MPQQEKLLNKKESKTLGEVSQGDCVQLLQEKDLFQVIGIDNQQKRCWVRRWPLAANGSPVFEIPTKQISRSSSKNRQCPINEIQIDTGN